MAMSKHLAQLLLVAVPFALAACGGGDDDTGSNGDAGQDSGTDTDSDTDADTDADTDTDTDADAGADSGADTDTELDSGPPGDKATWVSTGFSHACAVIEGGYVKCWGGEMFGELGYGPDLVDDTDASTSLPSSLPFVRVGEEVAEIKAGGYHTCVLLADSDAKCWGYNAWGELGVDTFESSPIGEYDAPADHGPIDFGAVKVKQVSAAEGNFTCAVLENGQLRCFGDGEHGETTGCMATGEDCQIDLGGAAEEVCTGVAHACALLESGEVYCWGSGEFGELGYGDTDQVDTPLDKGPVDVGGQAVQVACGYEHTCALLDTGDVVCWGDGQYGQLGYGNTDSVGVTNVPADVGPVDVGANVTQVTAGSHHTCVIIEGGDVKCWGAGSGGALGYGNPDDVGVTNVPADVGVVDVGAKVVHIDAGQAYNCVLTTLGTVRCWGSNYVGELGYGTTETYIGDDETPASMGDVPLL